MLARVNKLPGQEAVGRVRRQGLEPRTRGLRVRCFASACCRVMPGGAVLSATSPISLPVDTEHCQMVARQPSKHGANMVTFIGSGGGYGR
jgi:hypothetical protein